MSPTVAVVLAAGGGSRFSGPTAKLLAPLAAGGTLVEAAVATAVAADVGPVLVVSGAVAPPPLPEGVHVVANPRWAEGQATSLGVAVAWAREHDAEAVVVGLGDQPALDPSAWRAVAASASPLSIATYAGRRGHPVRLHAATWADLPTSGDEGARSLLRSGTFAVEEVPCVGDPVDIDTVADLAAYEERRRRHQ